jgi:hypothetical protein
MRKNTTGNQEKKYFIRCTLHINMDYMNTFTICQFHFFAFMLTAISCVIIIRIRKETRIDALSPLGS